LAQAGHQVWHAISKRRCDPYDQKAMRNPLQRAKELKRKATQYMLSGDLKNYLRLLAQLSLLPAMARSVR
jgi:hypothetical protein